MQVTFPTTIDLLVLAIAYCYVFIIIGIGEALRRVRGYSPSLTRKLIHLGAGFSIFTVPFYTHAWTAIIVAVSFVILVFLASPKSPVRSLRAMFEVMAREGDYLSGHIWGPFLYAISITVLVTIFTLIPSLTQFFIIPAMALTAMYLGDGLAPIIGAKCGKHRYTIGNSTRSIEGSLVVFLASVLGALFCFLFFDWFASGGIPTYNFFQMSVLALVCGTAATLIEGASPSGADNLTVPLLTTLIIFCVAAFIHSPLLPNILP
ncbi:MAG: diacylglycerol/polyprenol kinase family protein [Promethearchaeota archaeon]